MLPVAFPVPLATAPVTSPKVPDDFDAAVNGVGYMVDYTAERYTAQSVSVLKPQSDQGSQVGATSLNPEGLWPVTISDWSLGAGQRFFDKSDSDPRRFRTCSNIDIWDEGEIKQLKRGVVTVADTNEWTNRFVTTAGDRLYYTAGSGNKSRVNFTDDDLASGSGSFTTITGGPGDDTSDAASIASDGFHVYIAFHGNGLYLTNAGSGAMTSWITGMVDRVGYAKGRVMATAGPNIYNITTAHDTTAALPTALFTHRNIDFKWVDFAEGEGQIYAAGYSGDKSEIYRIAVQPDGTSLDVPVVAGRLPDGEVVLSIFGYLGFLLVGTSSGVRLAVEDGTTGNLTIGALIDTGSPCRGFAAKGRFVWFTWEGFDGSTSGLGRIDLQNLTDEQSLVPAYAPDIMYAFSAALVTDVVRYRDGLFFPLVGKGLIYESRTLYQQTADAGIVESGEITFNLTEPKIAVRVHVDAEIPESDDSVTVEMRADGGTWQTIGTVDTTGETVLRPADIEGSRLEIRLTLDGAGDTTPTVNLVQLFAHPRLEGTEKLVMPFVLSSRVQRNTGADAVYDVEVELERLKGWWKRQDLLDLTTRDGSVTAVLEDYSWAPGAPADDGEHRGLFFAEFKIIDDRMDN